MTVCERYFQFLLILWKMAQEGSDKHVVLGRELIPEGGSIPPISNFCQGRGLICYSFKKEL